MGSAAVRMAVLAGLGLTGASVLLAASLWIAARDLPDDEQVPCDLVGEERRLLVEGEALAARAAAAGLEGLDGSVTATTEGCVAGDGMRLVTFGTHLGDVEVIQQIRQEPSATEAAAAELGAVRTRGERIGAVLALRSDDLGWPVAARWWSTGPTEGASAVDRPRTVLTLRHGRAWMRVALHGVSIDDAEVLEALFLEEVEAFERFGP